MPVIFLLLCLSLTAFAKVEVHALEKKKVTIDVPENWESVKDLFGLPLTVLGPWENSARPAMSFLYTGMEEKKFPKSEMEKLFTTYKSDKKEWTEAKEGKLLSLDLLTPVKMGSNSGYFVGSEFEINNLHFIERSYYIACGGFFYNIKYSIRKSQQKYISDLEKIIGSFKCD